MRLTRLTVVFTVIQICVDSQKTTSYYAENEDSEIRARHLQSEIELIHQAMIVQERQLSEMKRLLEAVHRFMEDLLTNRSHNDCFQSQPTQRHSYLPSDLSKKHVSLVAKLDITDRWVYGVTKLHNLIYVLCYNPNSILVCEDKAPFALREIQTEQIRSPYNIVASRPWSCLFVIDIGNHCIWKVVVANETVSLWLTDIVHVTALSITSDGRVLVLNQDEMSYYLEIYGSDAALNNRIELHDLGLPFYAVQTSKGGFIVCHKTDDDVWLISDLDAEGVLIRSSNNEGEAGLSEPSHLFIDSSDRLFVADRWNSRVMLFDAELNWNRTILSVEEDGVQLPLRIYYDDEQHQLIVISGSGVGEIVDVYKLEFN